MPIKKAYYEISVTAKNREGESQRVTINVDVKGELP